MHIGIAAPVETSSILDLLGASAARAPAGYSGAPIIGVLARALIAKGHQVSLYTTDNSLLPKQSEPLVVQGDDITVFYCPSRLRSFTLQNGRIGRMADFFRLERQGLVYAIQQDAPDVVHAHWSYEFAWAAMEAKLPYILTFHDAPRQVLKFMPNLYRLGRYLMAKRVTKSKEIKTTVSPYMQQELMDWAGCSTELVPNPIEDAWFLAAQAPSKRDLRKPKIAMVINGWSTLKNPEPPIRAFSRIRAFISTSELHVFGSDFGSNELAQQWCEERGLSENIVFHGRVSYTELRRKLSDMTLLVHPSLEESFGMTLAEAMALALPVVAGEYSGALPWVCDGGKAGALVDVLDEKAIADAVLNLLSNPVKYIEIAQYAQQSAKARFSSLSVADAYEKYYLQAIQRAKSTC